MLRCAALRSRGHHDAEQARGPRILAQQATDTPLDFTQVAALPLTGAANLGQARFDPVHKTLPHSLFFSRSVGTAAQNEGLDTVGSRTPLDLQTFPECFPATAPHRVGELLEPTPRRTDNVPRPAFLQPIQGCFADHAAIQNPDACLAAVTCLQAPDDLFHGRAIVAVAGKHL